MTTYYVNSDTGNDANDGLSSGASLLTLSALAGKVASGEHTAVLSGSATFAASSLSIGTTLWTWTGSDVSIDVTTQLFSTTVTYQIFSGITWTGNTGGYLNGSLCTFHDCVFSGNRSFALYQYVFCYGCRFLASQLIAIYGAFVGCSFVGSLSTGNAQFCSFSHCTFYGTGHTASFDARVTVSHCSFFGYAEVKGQPNNVRFFACVFDGSTYGTAGRLPYGFYTYQYRSMGIVGCYGYVATTLQSRGLIDYSVLTESPFVDAAAGDFSPNTELAAIVGSDGLTPGAVQATAGGGGGVRLPNIRGGADQ